WLFRFKWDGTPTRITLGKFPALGLAEARQLAMKNREWLDKGIDPRRGVDRLGKRNSDDRTTSPAKSDPLAPGQEPSDPGDFEARLAATPKDRWHRRPLSAKAVTGNGDKNAESGRPQAASARSLPQRLFRSRNVLSGARATRLQELDDLLAYGGV